MPGRARRTPNRAAAAYTRLIEVREQQQAWYEAAKDAGVSRRLAPIGAIARLADKLFFLVTPDQA